MARDGADVNTPLLGVAADAPTRRRRVVALALAVGALAAGAFGVRSARRAAPTLSAADAAALDAAAAMLGYNTSVLRPRGNKPIVTYTLHLGCESDELKAANPSFWARPVTEARLVYHNLNSHVFFDWEHGLKMTAEDLAPGDSQTFFVDTDVPNWEYGFALKNDAGEILYEIGNGGANGARHGVPTAPLFRSKECTNAYGGFHNRMAPIDVMKTSTPGFVDASFGSCKPDCIPRGAYWDRPLADKQRMTAVMKTNPPRGLGAKFSMFGTNKQGVCTMNIHNQNGAYDDIMIHVDPRPKDSKSIIDFKTAGKWAGDYSGWRTQPWDEAALGPKLENDPNKKWWYTYEYANEGLKVYLNGAYKFTASWRSTRAYEHATYIDIWWSTARHVGGDGTCYLTPEPTFRQLRARVPL